MRAIRRPHPINQSCLYRLRSKRKLADILGVSPAALLELVREKTYREWATRPKYPASTHPALAHKPRDIQEPFGVLRQVQERISNLLSRLELPDYLQSARKGRSYRTNAAAHDGPGSAFRIDIRKFYQNVSDRYVLHFYRNDLECSPDVAHILTEISCFRRHLPTGSPPSPLISFLAYKPMFDELYALAYKTEAHMTVYVDDVVMSGPNVTGKLIPECKRILRAHGLAGHKVSLFHDGEVRVVTGVAIDRQGLAIPH